MSARSLLILDDDGAFRERLAEAFRRRGYQVATAADLAAAREQIAARRLDFAVVDLRLAGGENGLDAVRHLAAEQPSTRAIVLTGYGSIATAIDAIRIGAADYLSKPADADQIEAALCSPGSEPSSRPPLAVPSLDRVEWEHLQRVLASCDGNISKTARLLGIERRSLQRKLQKYPPPR